MFKRITYITATTFVAVALSGCGWFSSKEEAKAPPAKMYSEDEYKKVTKDRDDWKEKYDNLKKNPPVNVVEGLSKEACEIAGVAAAKVAKANMCSAPKSQGFQGTRRQEQHVAKVPQTPQVPAVPPACSGGCPAPQVPAAPPAQEVRWGGCVYTSDGTAILKGTKTKQPQGTELARISNNDLNSSSDPGIRAILARYPNAFQDSDAHKALCRAWSAHVAASIQEPTGLRVNDDTHRKPS